MHECCETSGLKLIFLSTNSKLRLQIYICLFVSGNHHQFLPVSLTSHQHCSQRHFDLTASGETGVWQWSWIGSLTTHAEVHSGISAPVFLFIFGEQELCATNLNFLNPTRSRDEAGQVRVSWSKHAVTTLRLV